jgi:hypothetical protein
MWQQYGSDLREAGLLKLSRIASKQVSLRVVVRDKHGPHLGSTSKLLTIREPTNLCLYGGHHRKAELT